MRFSLRHALLPWVAAGALACDSIVMDESLIRVGGNSPKGFYAGVSAETITPAAFETFTDLDFAEDATGFAGHRPMNGVFDGDLYNPAGDPASGIEAFNDKNGNKTLDAVWLAGSDSRRPANEVHDELWVRALAVRSGESTVIFLTLDAVGYFNDEIRQIREAAAKRVEFNQLVVSASHSHQTPDLIGIWGPEDGVAGWSPEYRKFVREAAVHAIVSAAQNAVPVVMAVNTGSIISPGSTMKPGNMHYDARDPVVIDDSVGVLQFKAAQTEVVVATLVTWAGHPEHMIDDNAISSDYPHYLRERLEDEYKGSTALFVNGVLGGQIGTNHADVIRAGVHFADNHGKDCRDETHSYRKERLAAGARCPGTIGDKDWMWKKAEAVGLNLAERAIELLKDATVDISPAIEIYSTDVYFPIENRGYRLMIILKALMDRKVFKDAAGEAEGDIAEYTINDDWYVRTDVQRIDFVSEDGVLLEILTVPGEMHPELAVGGWDGSKTGGIQPLVDPNNSNPPFPKLASGEWDTSGAPQGPFLRDKMKGKHNMLFGLTEDELGYIIPKYNWELDKDNPYLSEAPGDHYEETNSLGPNTAPILMKAYDELLAR